MTDGYCMKCKQKREIVDADTQTTAKGSRIMKGKCAVCGTGMALILPADTVNTQIRGTRQETIPLSSEREQNSSEREQNVPPPGNPYVAAPVNPLPVIEQPKTEKEKVRFLQKEYFDGTGYSIVSDGAKAFWRAMTILFLIGLVAIIFLAYNGYLQPKTENNINPLFNATVTNNNNYNLQENTTNMFTTNSNTTNSFYNNYTILNYVYVRICGNTMC